MKQKMKALFKDFAARFPRACPVVWFVRSHRRGVCLTFDDGPTTDTLEVLKILADQDAKATFFILAECALQRLDVLDKILEQGHEVGIHGYQHSMHDYFHQVQRFVNELSHYGLSPHILRPPGGVLMPILTLRLWWHGYRTVLWNIDTHDSMRLEGKWDGPKPDHRQIRAGDIVLMHDDNSLCIEELPALLQVIKQKNLVPITVSELLKR